MFFNFNKLNFLLLLLFSILISITSNNWLGCWIGLEINLMSFIPIISNNMNLLSSETSLKYFLTQTIASMNFLFIIIMKLMNFKYINMNLEILINSCLLMKMGAAPFHFWFVNIVEGLSWFNCFILMTWQKISPMILISYYYSFLYLMIISLISLIVGSLGGLNQNSLRKILVFSSINNLSWMIMGLMISINMWNMYFMFYMMLMLIMCTMLYMLNFNFLNQIFLIKMNIMNKIFFFLSLLSLGGLPPFLGFLPKWIIINNMMNFNLYLIVYLMVIFTLIVLFFYLQVCYTFFMIFQMKLKMSIFIMKSKLIKLINLMLLINLMYLLPSTLIYLII